MTCNSLEFVIRVPFGGLGDHLFRSHLPRIAKQHGGYSSVRISTLSECRHPDYRRLIWERNPWVDGFCDTDADQFKDFGEVQAGTNILDHIMLLSGLDDGQRFHEPELYFKPAILDSLQDAVVFDPNFVSFVGKIKPRHVRSFFKEGGYIPDYTLASRDKVTTRRSYGRILSTSSLEEYCSIVSSAKEFICMGSGGATLAAALGKPSLVLYGKGQKDMFHHSRLHRYVNINPGVSWF